MRNNKSALCLLDTHAWIWLINGDKRVQKLNYFDDRFCISAISIWEISMLESQGHLSFRTGLTNWLSKYLTQIDTIPLQPHISMKSCTLEGQFHGDPADRIITASAIFKNIPLATADRKIISYMQKNGFECIPLPV